MFDIHCHILPNVDDGSRSHQESVTMLDAARKMGIDRIVCTPHARFESWDLDAIHQSFQELCVEAERRDIELLLGHELYWRKLSELGISRAPEFAIQGTNLLLLELSTLEMPANWERLLYDIMGMGLEIIIAHPERYLAVQHNLDVARTMKEMGCYLQVSANFIEGDRRDPRRKTAIALLEEDLVDYVASDAHRVEHYKTYAKALEFCRTM